MFFRSKSPTVTRTRLIVCVDGTWCTPDGTAPKPGSEASLTNVYNVFASAKEGEVKDQAGIIWKQEKHYDPGLGALEKPGTISRLNAGLYGTGWEELIRDTYERCCILGSEDEIWLFGFSRGAYIIRAVASLLHYIGKVKSAGTAAFQKDYDGAFAMYSSMQGKGQLGKGQINHRFKANMANPPRIRFVGAFDTVKAIQDKNLFDMSLNASIEHFRHALAIHEDRTAFTPECIWPDDNTLKQVSASGRSFVQAWFTGMHIDIGGSAKEAGLALYPLQWMLTECQSLGLELHFHGNAKHAHPIDNPLNVVLPKEKKHGMGLQMQSFAAVNGLETKMQDLRSVHTLPGYGDRYKIKLNRNNNIIWIRKPRVIFQDFHSRRSKDAPTQMLRGYCSAHPVGTIIHPSVYFLLDTNINVVVDIKHSQLFQNLSEWSFQMLGEVELKLDGFSHSVANPGFWNNKEDETSQVQLHPLRILVCGNGGAGKSTLISQVFGADFNAVSHMAAGVHDVNEGVQVPGRKDIILHDSMGFEHGSSAELALVKKFIKARVDHEDLNERIHVVWLCIETNNPRPGQEATKRLFKAIKKCQRQVPVLLVATKKDQYISMEIGNMRSDTSSSLQNKEANALERLRERMATIETAITALEGARVDAFVCVSKDDKRSIRELTETSVSVFKDERTRLAYVKSQIVLPDLKINVAVHEVMRHYKQAVKAVVTTNSSPYDLAKALQEAQDDVHRRVTIYFGIKDLDTQKALKILLSNVRGSDATEGLTGHGVVHAITNLLHTPNKTPAVKAEGTLPYKSRLFLCTSCDLIITLARSFQTACGHGRAQPHVEDVDMAAKAYSKYSTRAHRKIFELVSDQSASVAYRKIHVRFAAIVKDALDKMAKDVANERPSSSRLEIPQATGGAMSRRSSRSSIRSYFSRWSSSTSLVADRDVE